MALSRGIASGGKRRRRNSRTRWRRHVPRLGLPAIPQGGPALAVHRLSAGGRWTVDEGQRGAARRGSVERAGWRHGAEGGQHGARWAKCRLPAVAPGDQGSNQSGVPGDGRNGDPNRNPADDPAPGRWVLKSGGAWERLLFEPRGLRFEVGSNTPVDWCGSWKRRHVETQIQTGAELPGSGQGVVA